MPIYSIKFIDRKTIARETVELSFEKPADFNFVPGQYCGFTLTNTNNHLPLTRRFSILSAPFEPIIRIATRIQATDYKQALMQLTKNDTIKIAGPTGNFVLHDEKDIPAVFLAGGIGITPFYCMIKQLAHKQEKRKIILFYANNSIEDAPFLDEFNELKISYPSLTFIPILQHAANDWPHERGLITASLIDNYFDSNNKAIYYVCGSPHMVQAMQRTLDELAIPSENIKLEDFPGY